VTTCKIHASNNGITFQFMLQVCKICVWTRNDGELFKQLKDKAQSLMTNLADLCDVRYQRLLDEIGGLELLSFRTDPKDMAGLVPIRRQDHPQVMQEMCSLLIFHESRSCRMAE
jgi:hypothetical protein